MDKLGDFFLAHNQLGYRNGSRSKRLIAPDSPAARNIFGDRVFWLMEQNRFSMESLNSPRQHEYTHRAAFRISDGDLGRWLVGDFSSVQQNGIYQAWCGNTAGCAFAVRDDVYRRIIPTLVQYFVIQSCGREVPGWHEACHLDDGFCPEESTYIEAAGGWHDAGDFRKWVSSTSMAPISLLIAHRTWTGREQQLGLRPDAFLDEAMQGVKFFLGMQDQRTGRVYDNVGGGRVSFHDNEDNRYTDNIPRSGDERRVGMRAARCPPKFTTLYAMYANDLRSRDRELSDRCLAAALKSDEFDRSELDESAESLQWRAWAHLELWQATSDEKHRAAALAAISALLALQVTDYIGGQKITRGFFRHHATKPGYHRKHVGAHYTIWVIAQFLATWPDHADAPRWKDAIRLWAEEYVKVFAARNAFGLLPYALYDVPPADHPKCTYRPLGDGLCFRYFTADNPFGVNARNALAASALSAAYRVTGDEALLDLAYQQLDWILGANPLMLSFVTGVGVRTPSALSFQMGNIPGGVTMGIGGDRADMPSYFNGAHPWLCCDEYYSYQNAHFLWAVTELENQQWSKR